MGTLPNPESGKAIANKRLGVYDMSMLFISYSTKDRNVATEVYDRLTSRGYHLPFLDYHPDSGIPGGSKWEDELRWQLKVSKGLVVLCSKNWQESKWCFAELDRAKEFGKEIIPVNLDQLELPATISPYQSIQFHERSEEAYQRLWRALEDNQLNPSDDFFWPRDECPYPGLAAFHEEHAGVFFGREQELSQFFQKYLDPMRQSGDCRLIYVIGPSGSGKSSFVRAGVLPRLRFKCRGAWQVLTVFRWAELKRDGQQWGERLALDIQRLYGAHPEVPKWNTEERARRYAVDNSLESFEAAGRRFAMDVKDALVALNRNSATPVIILDQFEELLATGEDQERARFLQFLQHCLAAENSPCRAIATVRSDFLPAIQQTPQLIVWNEMTRMFRLDQLKRERLFDVVRRPAEVVDVQFENDALVNRIVQEAQTPDALPLLAFTLKRFYDTCAADRRLTTEEYETELGGIARCLNSVAERILSDDDRPDGRVEATAENALRVAFVRELVRYEEADDEKGGKFVRKTANWDDLPAESRPLLEKMSSEAFRLVSIDHREDSATTIEVTHEALFRQWRTLKNWLDERRDLLRWKADVTRGRSASGETWSGLTRSQLATARDWLRTRSDELTDDEAAWIKAAKRKSTLVRIGIAVTAAMILAAAGIAWYFKLDRDLKQRGQEIAEQEKEFAEKRANVERLEREAQQRRAQEEEARSRHFTKMVYYFRAAGERQGGDFQEARELLQELDAADKEDGRFSLFRKLGWWDYYRQVPPPVSSVLSHLVDGDAPLILGDSSDLTQISIGGNEKAVTVLDLFSGQVVRTFDSHSSRITAICRLKGSSRIATADLGGRILLWDIAENDFVQEFAIPEDQATPLASGWPVSIADSGASGLLAVATSSGSLHIWNKATGEHIGSGNDPKSKPFFDDLPNLIHGTFARIEFNDDGTLLAVGHDDGNLSLWSVKALKLLTESKEHESGIVSLLFDAATIVTRDDNGGVLVWDYSIPEEINPDALTEMASSSESVPALNRREIRIKPVKADTEFSLNRMERPPTDQLLRPIDAKQSEAWRFASSERQGIDSEMIGVYRTDDGRMSVTMHKVIPAWMNASWEYTIKAFNSIESFKRTLREILARPEDVQAIVRPYEWLGHLINDERAVDLKDAVGKLLARAELFQRGQVIVNVWQNEERGLRELKPTPTVYALSPDGHLAYVADRDSNLIKVFDIEAEREVSAFAGHRVRVNAIAISSDGKLVASGSDGGVVILWDASSGKILQSLHEPDAAVHDVAFSPSGKLLAISFSNGSIRVLDKDMLHEIVNERLQEGEFTAVSFSSDDRVLVAGTSKGEVGVRKVAEDQPFVLAKGHPGTVRAVAGYLSENRELAISGSEDGTLVSWDIGNWPDHRAFPKSHNEVTALIASEDFRSLLSIGWTNQRGSEVNLWDSQLGLVLSGYGFHRGRIDQLAASTDSLTIWSVSSQLGGSESRLADLRMAEEFKRFAPMFQKESRPLSCDEIAPEALGEWYAFRGTHEHAIRLGELARERRTLPAGCLWLARSYMHEGREDLALREFRAIPVESLTAANRLYVNAWLRRFQLEARVAELETQSDRSESLVERAKLRLQLADFEHSIADLRQAVELDPDNASVRVSKAQAYEYRGESDDYRLAIDDYERAGELDLSIQPTYYYRHSFAFAGRGKEEMESDNTEVALRYFNKALTLRPDDYSWIGDRANVLAKIAKSKDQENESGEIIRLLGLAIEDCERIIEIDPQSKSQALKGGGIMLNQVTPGLVGLAHYNIACYRSLLSEVRADNATRQSDLDEAIRRLKLAIGNGFADVIEHSSVKGLTVRQAIEQDGDLNSLRNYPDYQQVLSELQ